MELKVQPYHAPEQILFNYEELKEMLLQKAEHYAAIVYTEDQVKDAKADRANLNRLKKALNDERLKREKEYMESFNVFKAQINEIIGIIDMPCAVIDTQIKAFEEQSKEEKMKEIHDYFITCIFPEGFEVDFALIFDEKWLNASTSMRSIQEAICTKLGKIVSVLDVVRSLPHYAYEAEQTYKQSLDLAKAVSEAHRLQAMAEQKAAWEAEQAKRKAEESAETIKPSEPTAPEPTSEKQWIILPIGSRTSMPIPIAAAIGSKIK